MTGDRIPTYANLVPESAIEAVAKQVLGSRLYAWSKHEGNRLCATFEKTREQLDRSIADVTEKLNDLDTGDYPIPDDFTGKVDEFLRGERAALESRMRENIASLDKLTTIHLKLSAGGTAAILSGMKQMRDIPSDASSQQERNVTPRRRYGAGLSYVDQA